MDWSGWGVSVTPFVALALTASDECHMVRCAGAAGVTRCPMLRPRAVVPFALTAAWPLRNGFARALRLAACFLGGGLGQILLQAGGRGQHGWFRASLRHQPGRRPRRFRLRRAGGSRVSWSFALLLLEGHGQRPLLRCGRTGPGPAGRSSRPACGRPASALTREAMRIGGSAMASATIGPLTRAMTGPSCRSLLRSHSQALSRDRAAEDWRGSRSADRRRSRAAAAARVPAARPGSSAGAGHGHDRCRRAPPPAAGGPCACE